MGQRHKLIVELRKLLARPFVFRFLLVLEIRRTFVSAKRKIWLPRAHSLHERGHSLSSLSGHCALLLDNLLTHFLEVAELSLGDVLSLDCAENLLDALRVLGLVESWLLEAKVFKVTASQTSAWQYLRYWPFELKMHSVKLGVHMPVALWTKTATRSIANEFVKYA